MRRPVISVRDVKVGEYMGLLVVRSQSEAQRTFLDALAQPGPLGKHPEDYQIHMVGWFDADTGILEGIPGVHDWTPYTEVQEQFLAPRELREAGAKVADVRAAKVVERE